MKLWLWLFNKVNWQHQQALFRPLMAVLMLGTIMVSTASTSVAVSLNQAPYYFMLRQVVFVFLGVASFYLISNVPLSFWKRYHGYFWLFSVVLLVLVFVPGLGHEVNGSRRWINLRVINVQPSELAKLAAVMYIAGFLVRRQGEIVQSWKGLFLPLIITSLMLFLLLLEPDFGASSVLLGAVMLQLFIGGVKPGQYFLLVLGVVALSSLALSFESYRVERLLAYLDPWAPENVYNTGYQLTQSLIAFGRGGLLGIGLGESIQKLLFLPEAHTDFVFAIWAEETGLLGGIIALLLLVWLMVAILQVVWQVQQQQQFFAAYVGVGIVALFSLQIVVNIGVNTGLLPTKGLTLPFYSYGGSSLVVCCMMVGIIARIAQESQSAVPTEEKTEVAYG